MYANKLMSTTSTFLLFYFIYLQYLSLACIKSPYNLKYRFCDDCHSSSIVTSSRFIFHFAQENEISLEINMDDWVLTTSPPHREQACLPRIQAM